MSLNRGGITEQMKKDLESYLEATNPDTKKFCAECGDECKTGQPLWNGWYVHEELYHLACVPPHLKAKYIFII
jgi:hypothetical protein